MVKILKIFGILFLVLVVVAIYGFIVGPKLDSDSQAYVDNTIPILVYNWNPIELKSRSSKELLPFLKEPDLSNLYVMFRRLGRITYYNSSKGEAHINFNIPYGVITTAMYIATAEFENGLGTIKMSLIRRNGEWKILKFRIESDIYLQQ